MNNDIKKVLGRLAPWGVPHIQKSYRPLGDYMVDIDFQNAAPPVYQRVLFCQLIGYTFFHISG